MSKYQEALDNLKIKYFMETDESEESRKQSFAKIQELVDRATPMKPYLDYGYILCKNCGGNIDDDMFCPSCGQKIDWSEDATSE